MPKATLTFILPDENEEFLLALHSSDYSLALHDMNMYLRNYEKYYEPKDWPDVEKIRAELFRIADKWGIEL